jgi:hypothetical protein
LQVSEGWKRTNITWRPSLLDILVTPSFYGDDLAAREKKTLGLAERQLAFRQGRPIPPDLKAAGLLQADVILGLDGLGLEMNVKEFLSYLRRNFLAGDRVTVQVLRAGRRIDLPLTLR